MSKQGKIQLAREFRKVPTKSEKIIWNVLRNRQFMNLKFRRQHLSSGYLLDFYCDELNLAIEIDGSVHDNEEQTKYDEERQKAIEEKKIKFIRIKTEDVENNLNNVLKDLTTQISSLLPRP
ncbi:MAG: endonuclease domain-containing protein [Patescibacteria group bacterium]|nr:endonuclease domain-containing protein [Patescibacteria group bacterium]MDD4610780.1 endonuclease domain-containing protein [Patescibacteria group bacterium]